MFQVGDVLNRGWEDFKRHAGVLIVCMIIAFGVTMVLVGVMYAALIGMIVAVQNPSPAILIVVGIAFMAVMIVSGAFFWLGGVHLCMKAVRGQELQIGDLFSQSDKLIQGILGMLALMLFNLLTVIPTLGAHFIDPIVGMIVSFAMYLPQAILMVSLAPIFYFIVDKELDVISAIGATFGLLRSNFMPMLLFGLLVFVLYIGSFCTCDLGMLIVMPVIGLSLGHIFMQYNDAADAKAAV